MSAEPRTLSDVHHDTVLLVGLLKGIEHMVDFARGDGNDLVVGVIGEALEVAGKAAQSVADEIEYLSGISIRPDREAAA